MSRYVIDKKKLEENIKIVKEKAGVPVIGVDATPAGQQSIRENKMYATVLQDAVGQSTTAFELMYTTATKGTAIGTTAGGITATTEIGEDPATDPAILDQCFLVPFKKVTKADLQ